MTARNTEKVYDIFVIGGGVNGAAIARDAAGRGYSVALAEMNDLASATSSASTKLFHGGLRYLEYLELGFVRHSLIEREILYRAMPHISWPMRFVLPIDSAMRFDSDSPVSRLLRKTMPWLQGRRPAWMIRLGLFLYDHLGGREILPPTKRLNLTDSIEGAPLSSRFTLAYEYSDVWVQDARLVVLLAKDAEERGARIMNYTKVTKLERLDSHWIVTTESALGVQRFLTKTLVNVAGQWVEKLLKNNAMIESVHGLHLVRGSHIVTKKLFDHDKCYFFQGKDGRIAFAIPYEDDFTLIGTTDVAHENCDVVAECSEDETAYLCALASEYFKTPILTQQVVWHFSGVRALYDNNAVSNTATTRDYILSLNDEAAPCLSVFGGKITTHRKLAEEAIAKLGGYLSSESGNWTANAALSGGGFDYSQTMQIVRGYQQQYAFADKIWIEQFFKRHGVNLPIILQDAKSFAELGQDFGGGLYQVEVDYLVQQEFACTAEDILWRRTKFGLRLNAEEKTYLADYMADYMKDRQ